MSLESESIVSKALLIYSIERDEIKSLNLNNLNPNPR